jgi:PAS domain S-box-containing protein
MEDEIGRSQEALYKLGQRIREASFFINELGNGHTEANFEINGEQDAFGKTLNSLKNSMVLRLEEEGARKEEDAIRNWTAQGVARFNDILRADNNDLEKLTFNIIKNIIEYMSANQGGIFLSNEDEKSTDVHLVAAYAYDRQKFLDKTIVAGEGLVGTCLLEKKTILMNKVPDDYITITSGLGGARPASLMIVPLKKDEEVLGVIEIASFNKFREHEVAFMEKIAESIAAALITVRLHLQTSVYLERFQQQAEEMKAQEEELRQNIEELQATHEQMERMKADENAKNQQMLKEMADYRKLLLDVLDHIPGKIFVKDHDGKLLLLNSEVAKVYSKTVDELIGTSDFDNHPLEDAKVYREKELEIMAKGAETYVQEESLTGSKRFLKTTKMPFVVATTGKTGLLGIQIDVTEFVEMEQRSHEATEELKAQEEELRQNLEELQTINEQMEKLKQEESERDHKMIKEMEAYRQLLLDVLDHIPGKIFVKDHDGKLLLLNSEVARVYSKTVDQLLGTSDFDNHPLEDAKVYREKELEIMAKGAETYVQEESLTGETRYLKTTKMPFYLPHIGQTGLLGFQVDETEIRVLEDKIHEMQIEINNLREKS